MRKKSVYLLLLLLSFSVFSQEKISGIKIDSTIVVQKQFDQQALQDFKSQDDFNYNVKSQENNFLDTIWAWFVRVTKRVLSWIFEDIEPALGFIATILKAIPWIVLALILFFVFKFFIKMNTQSVISDSENNFPVQLTNDEGLLSNQYLNSFLQKARNKKEYRQAIRYYYLLVLQNLTEKELIVWQIEKTNEDYIDEVAHLEIANVFAELTRLYDFVWYGNFEMNETSFLEAENRFNKLIKKILG